MNQEEKRIADDIWAIAHRGEPPGGRFTIMSGTIVAGSIDTDNYTCSVALGVDDDGVAPMEGVVLNAVSMNGNGVILYPADNSNVWVAEIDGPGKYGILKCSDLVKMQVTISGASIVMTSAGFSINAGGKNLKTVLNSLIGHIGAITVPTPSGDSVTPINIADFNTDMSDLNDILT